MTHFARYIGIDYSGAQTPNSSLKGLRVYMADSSGPAVEVLPPPSARKYWTRREIAIWLQQRLAEPIPTVVGIDHGFSFPLQYFETHRLELSWDHFLQDFHQHWPTDRDHIAVDSIRNGIVGNAAARLGNSRWRRLCEQRCRAKSVFHFDVQGSVAKSTHAGIPWLLRIRQALGKHVHFWPFDGWDVAPGRSVVAEVYPSLCRHAFPLQGQTPDQQDAYAVAMWLQQGDADGGLRLALGPALSDDARTIAAVEGWILGVPATAGVAGPNNEAG